MKSQKLKAGIFTTGIFYRHLKIVIEHFSDIRKSGKTGNVSNYSVKKIMLAVYW